MTAEQILSYGVEYNECLENTLDKVAGDFYPQIKMLMDCSSPDRAKLAIKSALMAFKRELREMENELNNKYA